MDLNATQAAIRAGYSKDTAHVQGPRLLGNASIKIEIDSRIARRAERYESLHDRVLRQYERLAFYDIRNAIDWDENGPVVRNDIDDDTAAAISEVAVPKGGGLRIKMADRKAALDSLAKHLGMFDGKKGADDPDTPAIEDSLRSAARDVAFLLRRAVTEPGSNE